MATRPSLIPAIFYKDPRKALAWLEQAFGFELVMLIETPDGQVAHSEMSYGAGAIMVGSEFTADHQSPLSVGGKNTQTIHIETAADIHVHFERAQGAGAEILQSPAEQFYGAITYSCRDPEGHIWTIAQPVKSVTREEAEAATGLKITGWV